MSAQSSALAPAHRGRFTRRAGTSTKLAIAAIAVVGAIVLAAGAVALSRGSAAPLAASGGGGHPAPMTSRFERALEPGSMAATAGTSVVIGPSTLIVESPVTGLNVRVPAVSTPMEQVIESQLGATSATSTVVITNAIGFDRRVPLP